MLDDHTPLHGLTVLRASRLEALLPPLQLLLEGTRPASVLTPQTVIAAHPGMRQWLAGELARHVGPGRIVANLEFRLPSAWLDTLSEQVLGQRAVALAHYRRGHLRWSVHALLDHPAAHGITDARVLDYLATAHDADEAALRRFQLADRLAQVYSQYLVYRPDWLEAWDRGVFGFATAGKAQGALTTLETRCLAPLWQALFKRLGEHRGRLMRALAEALVHTDRELPPLHVFGLSHLPPSELAVLRQYAVRAPVFLYVPDPCREYWGGLHRSLGSGRWRSPSEHWHHYREQETARCTELDALDATEQGHPLLAQWGRMGQHFFAALADGEVREDTRHWQDELDAAPVNRLERVQQSVRRLAPDLMAEDPHATLGVHDASLRVHACHTRLRELEVLRDALLDAIAQHGVKPWQMVVMAPDIKAYAPLIPVVFGQAGSPRAQHLPYHLADVPLMSRHRLLTSFVALLHIGASRITAQQVVDLLAVPELRRALTLTDDDADTLIHWLRASGVAWGLDGEHKTRFALPANEACTFSWAMDRLLAGYAMADAEDEGAALILPDGTATLPLVGIHGPAVNAIGSLDRLLQQLRAWSDMAAIEQPASCWAADLRHALDAIFRIEPDDHDARAAMDTLHRAISSIALEPGGNGEDPPLRLAVVRSLIEEHLAATPEHQRFLLGGITFCGMVPQRAIPFEVVCVLGLDEGRFPRRTADGGIDLMARLPRPGDRDVAMDDRYLFLETLMSARQRLHLSYIGQDVRDGKPRNPAAPLAELLAELDQHADLSADAEDSTRPWLVRHPLQAFDARYFDGKHPALFSYAARLACDASPSRTPLPRLRDAALPRLAEAPDTVALAALTGHFKNPARALLHDRLHISLDAADADSRLPEDEPLDVISPLHTVARTVFVQDVWPQMCAAPDRIWDRSPPDWVKHSGLLPSGRAGDALWQQQADAVAALCEAARSSQRFDAGAAQGGAVIAVDLNLPPHGRHDRPVRMTGRVHRVYALAGHAQGVHVLLALPDIKSARTLLKRADAVNFADLVPCWLHWAVLRLHHDQAVPVRCTVLADGEPDMSQRINTWDAAFCDADAGTQALARIDLQHRLRGVVAFWQDGLAGRSFYYPKTGWKAWQAVKASDDAGDDAIDLAALSRSIAETWAGGDYSTGERDYSPGFARLLEGELDFASVEGDPDHTMLKALLPAVRRLQGLITLDPNNLVGLAERAA